MTSREAIFITSESKFTVRDYEPGPSPSPYHVKIKVKWVGICGSDLHSIETKFLPELSLGHEWIGEVTEIGENVKGIKAGEFVTSTVLIKCGYCDSCCSNKEVCENQFSLAVSNGMLREIAYLPSKSLIKIPTPCDQNSTLFEIFAVAENVFNKSKQNLKMDQSVLILGAGLLGLSTGLVFNREGYKVHIIDTIPSRLKRAHRLGLNSIHLGEALLDKKLNDSFSFIVDATGDHLQSKGGWKYLDHFGSRKFKALILAKYRETISLKTDRLFSKEASIQWIQGCTEESLKMAIESWSDKINQLGHELITHTFELENVNEAFEMAKNREEAARVIVKIND